VRVFGIDPGSQCTGYGCVDSDGRRHQLVLCGAVRAGVAATFPEQLSIIYRELSAHLAAQRPDVVVIESIFHAVNARSALKLGHARGVAMLAATEAGVTVVEYTPAEIKRSVVGYGRAEAADALAVAICHVHGGKRTPAKGSKAATSWRHYKPVARAAR
jgi:crossover junction endodeoxyribonuclease RuvC